MNRSRITKNGFLLLGTAMLVWSVPAHAGFEFTAPKAPVKKQEVLAPEDAITAPMPIVPTESVTAEALDSNEEMSAMDEGGEKEPVYIRRQRTSAMLKAPKNQPMDTAALLKATENGDMVELEGQPRPNLAVTAPAADGALVINPYPLDSEQGATHGGGDMGKIATEQAMMEEGGNLRTVAVPGKNAPGMIARAKMTSRYDSASEYMDRAPVRKKAAAEDTSSMMTPIPGGEGEPLRGIVAQPLPAPKPIAPPAVAPRTAAPAPLKEKAQPVVAAAMPVASEPAPAAPAIVAPAAKSAPPAPPAQISNNEKTPSAPLIASRVSSANTTAMPRPARPETALPPVAAVKENPPAPQPSAPVQTKAAPAQYAEAVGFGRDLPLALALSQIVPPEYSYAFGADVNVGAVVSWQGGKPWNQVLDDTLAQQGLRAVISDTQITIVKSGKAA